MNASVNDLKYSRQSFIGNQSILETTLVGVVGLGGGGSAILTQLAHAGFRNVVGLDPNKGLEEKHLNRTLGVSQEDITAGLTKVDNAVRIFRRLQPNAKAHFIQARWQDRADLLENCKIIWGCLDGLSEREQLESFCRSKDITLIDIGLGVTTHIGYIPRMAGQIIVSRPGGPCMHCMGFLNEADLAAEAGEYGNAGFRPQVIWGNMVLAGQAMGLGVQLLTEWAGPVQDHIYLQYDGNSNIVIPHPRLRYLDLSGQCQHFMNQKTRQLT